VVAFICLNVYHNTNEIFYNINMKIIDMHCDTIRALIKTNQTLRKNDLMVDLERLKETDYLLQCFAMFVVYENKNHEENYSPFDICNEMIDRYKIEMESNKDIIKPVLTYQDIENNITNNMISSLLTIEEGGTCLGNIDNLIHFYNRGVRMITLTWNYQNEIGSPNINYFVPLPKDGKFIPNTTDGLTDFGKKFVKKMNELGIIIDCSHASDKTFYDVIEISTKPIVCSHSNARCVCDFVRNMSDDMLLKLKENNGVVGINFCHDFVTPNDKLSTIEDLVKHIDYIKNLIGIDYIGLGSDFDGISNKNIEMKECSLMPKLLEALRKHHYTEEDIDKITHKNMLRILKENLA